jgi:pimeloyl-ACP methyl ester carboxylesterase
MPLNEVKIMINFKKINKCYGVQLTSVLLIAISASHSSYVLSENTSHNGSGVKSNSVDKKECENLMGVTGFPVEDTNITLSVWHPEGQLVDYRGKGYQLPPHCQVQGVVQERVGSDGYPYGTRFEVRLPARSKWNQRFQFQGGGYVEGSLPPAVGVAGTLTPSVAHGWAVVSQDGGHHANKGGEYDPDKAPSFAFALDEKAVEDFAYNSIDYAARTAKYLIEKFYEKEADYSYHVGCSNGGRQGLVFANRFPDYFDGVIAGEPAFNLQSYLLSVVHVAQQLKKISPLGEEGRVKYEASFSDTDRELFTKAILASCDELDGLKDSVVDFQPVCNAIFDPATFRFPGSGQPLQCAGDKTDSCLSAQQIAALKSIHDGPRNDKGERVRAPLLNEPVPGYPWDGGIMLPDALPRYFMTPYDKTSISIQGEHGLLAMFSATMMAPPRHGWDATEFDLRSDMGKLNQVGGMWRVADTYDAKAFSERGGKLIMYTGLSSPGPTVENTMRNWDRLNHNRDRFAKMYTIPNMGHCRGGNGTEQFDMLTPLVSWVEDGVEPGRIVAKGENFISAPKSRSRPLCPYPQVAKYDRDKKGSIAEASSYSCVTLNEEHSGKHANN